ncbi:unnamed protein product [Moneuplotes crassus]|uniref:Uncharacterized protein n=1 Tax=Euplotes crassus TaxID=5936 RepID=A0AAD1UIJ3_EUPCR|nr:unnamed protein product [Moneuplotes crassus]
MEQISKEESKIQKTSEDQEASEGVLKKQISEEGGHASTKEQIETDQSLEAGISFEKLTGKISSELIFEDDEILNVILEFFTLGEIVVIFFPLNSRIKGLVQKENYLLFEKLIEELNITSCYTTSDLPVYEDIGAVYKQAICDFEDEKETDLKPQAFYTDSGIIGSNMWYGFHNIFGSNTSNIYGGYVFSSNKSKNNHVQFYLSVPTFGVDNKYCQTLKTEFELTPGSKEIKTPYLQTMSDKETPLFKVPTTFEVNLKNQGFSYYADNLLLCFSASEVRNKRFQSSTKIFDNFKTPEDVEDSGLPILHKDTETKGFTVIEFDLSQKSAIKKAMGVKRFYSIPLIYCYLEKNALNGTNQIYQFKQKVAAKYMSMKLLCCSSQSNSNQIDMYPCKLKGKTLHFG